jgi:hypothetical protein
MAGLKLVALEASPEAPRFAGVRVLALVDVQAATYAGDHVAIFNKGNWDHCVMGRSRERCLWCLMGTESGVREERLSTVCGGGAVVVLIEYEGGKEECSYEWAKEQMALMEANTLQRRILRCEGDLEFAVRSRRLRCASAKRNPI